MYVRIRRPAGWHPWFMLQASHRNRSQGAALADGSAPWPVAPTVQMASDRLSVPLDKIREPTSALLDDLVSAQQEGLGNIESQGLGRLQVDEELELGWLLHRKVSRV